MSYERISGSYLKAAHLNTISIISEGIRNLHGPFSINTDMSYIRTEEVRSPLLWSPLVSGDDWPYAYELDPEYYVDPQSFTIVNIKHDHDRDIWLRVKVTGGEPPEYVTWFRGHETPFAANDEGNESLPWKSTATIWMQSGEAIISGHDNGNFIRNARIPVNTYSVPSSKKWHIDYIDITYSGDGQNRSNDWSCEDTHVMWGWVRHGTYASVVHLLMDESPENIGGCISYSGSLSLDGSDPGDTWEGSTSTLRRFDIIYNSADPTKIYTWEGVRGRYNSSGYIEFILNGLDASPSGLADMSNFDINNFICVGSNRYYGEIYN